MVLWPSLGSAGQSWACSFTCSNQDTGPSNWTEDGFSSTCVSSSRWGSWVWSHGSWAAPRATVQTYRASGDPGWEVTRILLLLSHPTGRFQANPDSRVEKGTHSTLHHTPKVQGYREGNNSGYFCKQSTTNSKYLVNIKDTLSIKHLHQGFNKPFAVSF